MNEIQMQAAKKDLVKWLSHPHELGKKPAKIEVADTFEMDSMTYYIFKYKENAGSEDWLLGIAGGYEGKSTDHSGHVFSQMEVYEEETAQAKARELVDMIKGYWMKEAGHYQGQGEENEEGAGAFVGFALLSQVRWDRDQLIADLEADWGIEVDLEEDENEEDQDNQSLVFDTEDGYLVAVSLMPAPVPDGEAEINAENNYMWQDAVKVAKAHQGHLMVAVLGQKPDYIAKGKIYTKVLAACCKQEWVSGIYTSGTVFEPKLYADFAMMMKQDLLPIFNWVYLGLYQSGQGVSAYTYGLNLFQKEEMEVLDAQASPEEVYDFLAGLVSYVLSEDVVLRDGETIGFTADDKHAITYSDGVALPQKTLKISFDA